MIEKIVSGGQTGADRAALDWAINRGIPHGGWCPKGRLAEDGTIPVRYNLHEMRSKAYPRRTEQNVIDSDGTVILTIKPTLSGGSKKTADFAEKHRKPLLHLHSGVVDAGRHLADFIARRGIKTLNVAGPRASTEPTITEFIVHVLDSALHTTRRATSTATSIKPLLQSCQMISLLSRHQIHLRVIEGDGRRFAELFRQTWRLVPLWARRKMLKHWRTKDFFIPMATRPEIKLHPRWDRERARGLRGTKAAVFREGHELRFWSKIVDTYPDDLVRDLIAHELAHVVQEADASTAESFMNAVDRERDADEMVEQWGFSAYAIDEWDEAHGLTKRIDLKNMSPEQKRRVFRRTEKHIREHGR